MFSISGVMVLFGLTWLFGILTVVPVSGLQEAFQIIFTIFNAFQGFFIFLFFCVLNREARHSWMELITVKLLRRKKKEIPSTLTKKSLATESTEMSTVPQPSQSAPRGIKFSIRPPSKTELISPSDSKPGKILGLTDLPETTTFHKVPSKPTFMT